MWQASFIYSTHDLVYLYSALWLLMWFSWTEVFFRLISFSLFCDLLSLLLNLLQAYNIMLIFGTLFGSVFSSMYTVDVHLQQGVKVARTIYLSFYKICRKMKVSVSSFVLCRRRTLQNKLFCGVNWSLKRWIEASHSLGIRSWSMVWCVCTAGKEDVISAAWPSFLHLPFHSTFICQMSPMVGGWQQCILNWMFECMFHYGKNLKIDLSTFQITEHNTIVGRGVNQTDHLFGC